VALRNEAKSATLQGTHLFQPVVVESLGTVEKVTSSFWTELGHRISTLPGDNCEISFFVPTCFGCCTAIQLFCCGKVFLQRAAPEMDGVYILPNLIFSSLGIATKGQNIILKLFV